VVIHGPAHLLLQVRPRVFNGEWEATCQEGSPGFRAAPQQVAACAPESHALV
jgi:hypothetical protein